MKEMFEELKRKIKDRDFRVGVVGLGYVGLPLAIEFYRKYFPVIGFDIDGNKIRMLRKCQTYITDIRKEDIPRQNKRFITTNDFSLLKECDAIIICVPTPLRKSKKPDISYVLSATKTLKRYLRKGQIVVLESTTYPGTTRDLLLKEFSEKRLEVGKDYFLGFSPERIDPGNKRYNIRNTTKIVSGITRNCAELIKMLYKCIVKKVMEVSSPESAEMVKLLENTFRAVNIALANEMALICDRLRINVWEVIEAAKTKPYGFMSFYPGPGLGGHCIPVDPKYLSWKMKTLNFSPKLINVADVVNSFMPLYVVNRLKKVLRDKNIKLKNSKIFIVGVTYKKNINDIRESPALTVIEKLLKLGIQVSYNDPYISKIKVVNKGIKSKKLLKKSLRKAIVLLY